MPGPPHSRYDTPRRPAELLGSLGATAGTPRRQNQSSEEGLLTRIGVFVVAIRFVVRIRVAGGLGVPYQEALLDEERQSCLVLSLVTDPSKKTAASNALSELVFLGRRPVSEAQ